jgi:hypothetical protein
MIQRIIAFPLMDKQYLDQEIHNIFYDNQEQIKSQQNFDNDNGANKVIKFLKWEEILNKKSAQTTNRNLRPNIYTEF